MTTTKTAFIRNTPVISTETVKRALDVLIFAGQPGESNPLETLMVIEDALIGLATPEMPHPRRYLLGELLTSMIATTYMRYRLVLDLPCSDDFSIHDVEQSIRQDGESGNLELLSWCWLYYHYVRYELDITRKRFCELVAITSRTLTRYQDHGLHRLMIALAKREQDARERRWRYHRDRHFPTTYGSDEIYIG